MRLLLTQRIFNRLASDLIFSDAGGRAATDEEIVGELGADGRADAGTDRAVFFGLRKKRP